MSTARTKNLFLVGDVIALFIAVKNLVFWQTFYVVFLIKSKNGTLLKIKCKKVAEETKTQAGSPSGEIENINFEIDYFITKKGRNKKNGKEF